MESWLAFLFLQNKGECRGISLSRDSGSACQFSNFCGSVIDRSAFKIPHLILKYIFIMFPKFLGRNVFNEVECRPAAKWKVCRLMTSRGVSNRAAYNVAQLIWFGISKKHEAEDKECSAAAEWKASWNNRPCHWKRKDKLAVLALSCYTGLGLFCFGGGNWSYWLIFPYWVQSSPSSSKHTYD